MPDLMGFLYREQSGAKLEMNYLALPLPYHCFIFTLPWRSKHSQQSLSCHICKNVYWCVPTSTRLFDVFRATPSAVLPAQALCTMCCYATRLWVTMRALCARAPANAFPGSIEPCCFRVYTKGRYAPRQAVHTGSSRPSHHPSRRQGRAHSPRRVSLRSYATGSRRSA